MGYMKLSVYTRKEINLENLKHGEMLNQDAQAQMLEASLKVVSQGSKWWEVLWLAGLVLLGEIQWPM